jgi:tRNA dimethylallyltransferase
MKKLPTANYKLPITPPPLVVIVGPTASGKSDLAMRAAEDLGGEIICADSRTVYKGMDIGTAKPSKKDQKKIRHRMLDIVKPGERFTAGDFQRLSSRTIEDIWARGYLPIMVGGTGLYIDSVLFNYRFGSAANEQERKKLTQKPIEDLIKYCLKHNVKLPDDVKNKRRLIRVIEQGGVNRKRNSQIRINTLVVGISAERNILKHRIESRAKQMFKSNVVEEAAGLAKKYGWESEAMTGSIYKIIRQMLAREITKQQALRLFITSDMRLAKRQMTWFKRNPSILWSDNRDELLARITYFAKRYTI